MLLMLLHLLCGRKSSKLISFVLCVSLALPLQAATPSYKRRRVSFGRKTRALSRTSLLRRARYRPRKTFGRRRASYSRYLYQTPIRFGPRRSFRYKRYGYRRYSGLGIRNRSSAYSTPRYTHRVSAYARRRLFGDGGSSRDPIDYNYHSQSGFVRGLNNVHRYIGKRIDQTDLNSYIPGRISDQPWASNAGSTIGDAVGSVFSTLARNYNFWQG